MDIPYGNDFELKIPCDSQVGGCLVIRLGDQIDSLHLLAHDEDKIVSVFIDAESQALMVIAACQAFIGRLKNLP